MADIQEALLTYIYNILMASSGLETAMGGTIRLKEKVPPDTEFPYLVHRIDPRANPFYPMGAADYYLDIYSDSPTSEEILDIRVLIMSLLDELEFNTDEASRARLTWSVDTPVPEPEDGIWHRAMRFDMWYFRDAEITAIDAR